MKIVFAMLLVLVANASPANAQAQPPLPSPPRPPAVFGAQVDNVFVDAFVSQRREPVTGLAASDFELKDNGVVQRLDLVAAEELPLLAVLVFDSSNSLAGEKLVALQAAGRAFLESLRPQDEVSLFTFAGETQWLVRPTPDKAAVGRALDQLQAGGATSVLDALYASLILPKARGRTLVVLFTDGEDNMSWLDWKQMQRVAERSNALIHVVGLKRTDDMRFTAPPTDIAGRMLPAAGTPSLEWLHTWGMRQIAESTGGRYWEAESPARLKTAFAAITEIMALRYILSYEPQGVKAKGWHEIELRLKNRTGDVHARRGYWVAGR
jgi:VWFA-related protein